jgi:diguanylate cyclase (GGDEF)-like protein
MRQEAETDFLTQVSNRRSFMARLSVEVDRLQFDPNRSSALLAIDLDHFKAVNDTFGHAGGDAVLVHVAAMMAESIRPTDAVARSGGEEFLVLVTDTTPDHAIAFAERLRAGFEERPTFHDGHEIRVTASIGLTLIADDVDSADAELLARADGALYDAKRAGRNAVKADWL